MLNRARRLLSSDWGLYAVRGGIIGNNFLSLLLIALLMEAGDFGRFSLMWAATLTLSALASLGAPAFLLRELSARQAGGAQGVSRARTASLTLLWPALILVLATGTLHFGAAALPPSRWTPEFTPAQLGLVAGAAYLVNLTNVLAVPFRVAGHVSLSMLLRDTGPQALMVLAALLLWPWTPVRPEPAFLLFVFLTLPLIALAGLWLRSRARARGIVFFAPPGSAAPPAPVTGFWGSTIVSTAWTQIDILLAALFLSPATLGHYQIVKRLANLASMPQIIANWAVIVPVGRAFARDDAAAIQDQCRRAARLSALPLAALCLATTLALPVVIALFDLPATVETWGIFALLLAGAAANVLFGANFAVANQCRMEFAALRARISGIVLTGAAILALGGGGPLWVAGATLAGTLLSNFQLWLGIRRRLSVDTSLATLARAAG